jgi:hypothetical protein
MTCDVLSAHCSGRCLQVLAVVLLSAISRRIDRGGFTVKWGDKENTASEATQQLRKAVGDLTDNLRAAT